MLCHVTELRRRGLRLQPAELAEPVLGVLHTQWRPPDKAGRPVMVADVWEHWGTTRQRTLLLTLLDVTLHSVLDGQLLLAGVQLHHDDGGRVVECRQVWRCMPVVAA